MKTSFRYLPPLIGLAILAFLLAHYDIRQIVGLLKEVNPFWFAVVVLSLIISSILGALNVFLLFRPEDRKISFGEFLGIYWFGWAMSLIVPGQVGDVASTTVLLKKRGMVMHKSLGLLLIDKVISLLTMLSFALIGVLSAGSSLATSWKSFEDFSAWLGFFVIIFLVGIFLISSKRFQQTKLGKFIRDTVQNIWTTSVKYPGVLLRNISITLFKVSLIGFAYTAMFWAFGAKDISLVTITGLALASGLVAYLPISFNGLGTVEFAGLVLFKTIGISEQVTLSSYLLLRLSGLLIAWLPVLIWRGLLEENSKGRIQDEDSNIMESAN